MANEQPDPEALSNRLTRIEIQNRRLKTTNLTLFLIGAAAVLMGQATPRQETVEAKEFIVRDRGGNVRATFGMSGDAPALTLYSADKIAQATLVAPIAGPEFTLHGPNGTIRVQLALSNQKPSLLMRDADENLRATLQVNDNGPSLALYDHRITGRPGRLAGDVPRHALAIKRVELGVMAESAHLSLHGFSGDQQAVLAAGNDSAILSLAAKRDYGRVDIVASENSGPAMSLIDTEGAIRALLDGSKDGPSLTLRNREGKSLFSAP